jgi:Tol biopolymer transport system component/DNA-binding winged helix-turn-helix (wHTH) protein
MTLRTGVGAIVRFSVFELDLRSGELRKNGARVPLQGQPLEILKALLERPGDLVTREELRQRLWRDDTFVDFEDGMNAAIRRLRDALGDDASTPRFVETLPRRGYRFIAPLLSETTAHAGAGEPTQRSPRWVAAKLPNISWAHALPWLFLGIVVASTVTWRLARRETQRKFPTVRFEISTPPLAVFGPSPAVALSPDGNDLAYGVSDVLLGQLYLRHLGSLEAKAIAGADHAQGPFFSPDGKYLAFFTRGTLQKVSVAGGSAATVCSLPTIYADEIHGGSWGDDGNILFESGSRLWRVSEKGGVPQRIPMPDDTAAFFPEVLPAKRAIVFTGTRLTPSQQSGVWALSLRDGQLRLLVEGGEMARYLSSGHLLYSIKGSLAVAPLDLESLTLTAPSVTVISDLRNDIANPPRVWVGDSVAHFTVSHTGALAYVSGPTVPVTLKALVWVDREGNERPLPEPSRAYSWPRLSPDGSRLAVGIFDGDDAPGNVRIYDFARRAWTLLTSHPAQDGRPLWTPDGLKVAFRSFREGTSQLFLQSVDSSGQTVRLTDGVNPDRTPWSFSPDGQELVFSEFYEPSYDLQVLKVADRSMRTVPRTRFFKGSPALSPNGRWLAYRSDESGHDEVYVRPFQDWDKTRKQVSTSGGRAPAWSADGRELFFLDLSGAMMAVAVQTSGDFLAGTPKLLFKGKYVQGSGGARNYDVDRDGKRFLMIKQVSPTAEPPPRDKLIVVLNWTDEVRKALATAK